MNEFYDKYKKMFNVVERMARRIDDGYYIARMAGFMESMIYELPRTPDNLAWMDRVIDRAEKMIMEAK